jgi:hypothetical protein
MKPAAQRFLPSERARFAYQDQERRLEGILRVVLVAERSPADAEDHRAVPLDKGRERQLGGFTIAGPESLKELAVR